MQNYGVCVRGVVAERVVSRRRRKITTLRATDTRVGTPSHRRFVGRPELVVGDGVVIPPSPHFPFSLAPEGSRCQKMNEALSGGLPHCGS